MLGKTYVLLIMCKFVFNTLILFQNKGVSHYPILQVRKLNWKEVKCQQLSRGLTEMHAQICLAINGTPLTQNLARK